MVLSGSTVISLCMKRVVSLTHIYLLIFQNFSLISTFSQRPLVTHTDRSFPSPNIVPSIIALLYPALVVCLFYLVTSSGKVTGTNLVYIYLHRGHNVCSPTHRDTQTLKVFSSNPLRAMSQLLVFPPHPPITKEGQA